MTTYVAWVELNQVKLFKINREGKESRILRRHEIKHHTSRDPENHKNGEKFFHEIAQAISDADEILLMGPDLTKEHFKKHLEVHHHKGLADKIVGMRTLDLMRDEKLLAESRAFFKEYDLFEAPIR